MAVIVVSLSHSELEEIKVTQRPSEKRFILGETEYKERKVVVIPGEIGLIKLRVKTEVVEGDIPWIMGKDWMIENGLEIDMNKK